MMSKEATGRLILEASTGQHGDIAKQLTDAWADMAGEVECLGTRLTEALDALREARRLNNLTVRAENEISVWHREADRLLADSPAIDDPSERYDAPSRVAHRAFVDRLFQKR